MNFRPKSIQLPGSLQNNFTQQKCSSSEKASPGIIFFFACLLLLKVALFRCYYLLAFQLSLCRGALNRPYNRGGGVVNV